MIKLRIKELYIRNFRSFGDAPTILNISKLGPTLILGQVDSDEMKSNGAGKTTISDAIIWCLFGRTPSKVKPSDDIINRFTKKDCIVKITTIDGYIITRTRNMNDHNDLLIHQPDGVEISDSTNINAQKHLNKLFGLDYDIFTTHMFFTQAGESFMELTDQKRKKALERALRLTKYDMYAQVAKEIVTNTEKEQSGLVGQCGQIEKDIIDITNRLQKLVTQFDEFECNRQLKVKTVRDQLASLNIKYEKLRKDLRMAANKAQTELELIELGDITQLKKQWLEYEKDIESLEKLRNKINNITTEISKIQSKKNQLLTNKEIDYTTSISVAESQVAKLSSELTEMEFINVESLTEQWKSYDNALTNITTTEEEIDTVISYINKCTCELKVLLEQKSIWENKAGTICHECYQEIKEGHIHATIAPFDEKLTLINNRIKKSNAILNIKKTELDTMVKAAQSIKPAISLSDANKNNSLYIKKQSEIETAKQALADIQDVCIKAKKSSQDKEVEINKLNKQINDYTNVCTVIQEQLKVAQSKITKPKMTVQESELLKKNYELKKKEIDNIESRIQSLTTDQDLEQQKISNDISIIMNESNPYQKLIDDIKNDMEKQKKVKMEIEAKIAEFNKTIKHVEYIKQAYSDRKKIKAYILQKLVPYLNERLKYYTDAFDCDFGIEFNSFLQMKSNILPYELWSGGEKVRMDISLQFALYDLHQSIYDAQCNVLVFDEVAESLDSFGVATFTNLLFKDFVGVENAPDAILVISHKNEMRDVFPSKLIITKENDVSKISEILH